MNKENAFSQLKEEVEKGNVSEIITRKKSLPNEYEDYLMKEKHSLISSDNDNKTVYINKTLKDFLSEKSKKEKYDKKELKKLEKLEKDIKSLKRDNTSNDNLTLNEQQDELKRIARKNNYEIR
ncbi:MAG: hypothetical protein IJ105_04155 [Bacilli bacterium]|nr:hypothetical protein [Bacilli bacterium]